MQDLVNLEIERFKYRQRLILKLEENGFASNEGGLFYKKIKINKFEAYLCFAMNYYLTRDVLLTPKFGLSENAEINISFTKFNWFCFFDTDGNKDACKALLRVFDSIMNFFCDGKAVNSKYKNSVYTYCANEHLKFSVDPSYRFGHQRSHFPTFTFSSSGKYFISSDAINSEESDDLYGR
jgi:hypothetical protein